MTHAKDDPDAPNLVVDEDGEAVGIVTHWNPCGMGECIVQYFDGSADSAFFRDLAFRNGDAKARDYLNDREP